MTPAHRRVIALAKEGKPYKVIAYETGLSLGYVGLLIHKARRANPDAIPRRVGGTYERVTRTEATRIVEMCRRKRPVPVQVMAEKLGRPVGTVVSVMARLRQAGRIEYRYGVGQ